MVAQAQLFSLTFQAELQLHGMYMKGGKYTGCCLTTCMDLQIGIGFW